MWHPQQVALVLVSGGGRTGLVGATGVVEDMKLPLVLKTGWP